MMSKSDTAYAKALTLPIASHLAQMSLGKSADPMMQVMGFHDLYNVPMQPFQSQDEAFQHMTNARVALRIGFLFEELGELLKDGFGIEMRTTFHITPDNPDRGDWRTTDLLKALDNAESRGCYRDGEQVADALTDLVYFIYGFAIELGYDLRATMQEVHGSNMTKLGEDGKPIYREDGKVLKGPNYMKPNIRAALGWDPKDPRDDLEPYHNPDGN